MFKKHKYQTRNDGNEFDDKMAKSTLNKLHVKLNKIEVAVGELSENISQFSKHQSGKNENNQAVLRRVKKKYKVIKD